MIRSGVKAAAGAVAFGIVLLFYPASSSHAAALPPAGALGKAVAAVEDPLVHRTGDVGGPRGDLLPRDISRRGHHRDGYRHRGGGRDGYRRGGGRDGYRRGGHRRYYGHRRHRHRDRYYSYGPYFYYPFTLYDYAPYYYSHPRYRTRHYSRTCRYWSRRCTANWGYGNSNYYGCMRYHGCR